MAGKEKLPETAGYDTDKRFRRWNYDGMINT